MSRILLPVIRIFYFLPKHVFAYSSKLFYNKEYNVLKQKLLLLYYTSKKETEDTIILEKMLIVAEDHRFYSHYGIDFIAIIRAIYKNRIINKKQGASTIEQQLVRTLLQIFDRTYKRKIKELLLASSVSFIVPKKTIPTLYLRVAYYGRNLSGYESVRSYLKLEEPLNVLAAAKIVSRIKYPQSSQNETKDQKINNRIMYLLSKYEKCTL